MDEYINKTKLIEDITSRFCKDCDPGSGNMFCRRCEVSSVFREIIGAPTADVVEVKHGRWEQDSHWQYDYVCSICGEYAPEGGYGNHDNLTDYCPNCGAKMMEVVQND